MAPRAPVSLGPEVPFFGFSSKARKLLRDLGRKQDREWFGAHKADYEALWQQPMGALLDEIRGRLGKVYPALSSAKVFRVQRDVRPRAGHQRATSARASGSRVTTSPATSPSARPAAAARACSQAPAAAASSAGTPRASSAWIVSASWPL